VKSDEIRAALERIEERQAAYEIVAMRILQTLQGMTVFRHGKRTPLGG